MEVSQKRMLLSSGKISEKGLGNPLLSMVKGLLEAMHKPRLPPLHSANWGKGHSSVAEHEDGLRFSP